MEDTEMRLSLFDTDVEAAQASYRNQRERCPVALNHAHDGHWLVSGYDEVRQAAKDWQRFSSADGVDLPRRGMPETLISSDPPAHTEFRKVDREAINPDTVEALRPFVARYAQELIDALSETGPVDIVSSFADLIPPAAIARIVGLDPELATQMRDVSLKVGASMGDDEAFASAMAEFAGFVFPQIELRRREPRHDFLTRIATRPVRGAMYSDEQILTAMLGFLLAGHESTTAAIASTTCRLLEQPERWHAVRHDRRLLAGAIEETLRLDTPFHQFRRKTTCPVDLGGVTLAADDDVMLNYAAANRDARAFTDPDVFNMERRPNSHMAFGYGIHACLGAGLARMELNVALGELLDRLPKLALAVAPEEIKREFHGGNLAYIPAMPVFKHGR